AQTFGRRWADQNGVVPGELGDRLGEFLQPAVVGECTVEDDWISVEIELKLLFGKRRELGGQLLSPVVAEVHVERGCLGIADYAVMERRLPPIFEVAFRSGLLAPIV